MASNDNKRYYWLKLQKDFFKKHNIKIVEDMPNGKDYILFYLKLLCESTSHEGELRYSSTIPYNEQMLASVTNTNVDIVKSAIQIFRQLQMIEILDDGTLYMTEVQKMIGSETGQTQRKTQAKLEKEQTLQLTNKFKKPTIDEITQYCQNRKNNVDPERFYNYYEANGWKVGKSAMKNWEACIRTWEKNSFNNSSKPEDVLPTYDMSKNRKLSKEEEDELLKLMGKSDKLPKYDTSKNITRSKEELEELINSLDEE